MHARMASLPLERSAPKEDAVVTAGTVSASSNPDEVEKSPLWRRALGMIWDYEEGDKRNRKYVQKLDAYLLYETSTPT